MTYTTCFCKLNTVKWSGSAHQFKQHNTYKGLHTSFFLYLSRGNRSILTSRQTYWKSCHKTRLHGWSMVWISGSVTYLTQSPEREKERVSKWTEIRAKSHIACCFLFCPSFFPPFMRFNPPFHPYSIPISSLLLEARLRLISEIRAGVGVCVCVCVCVYLYELQNDPLIHDVLAYIQTVSMYH